VPARPALRAASFVCVASLAYVACREEPSKGTGGPPASPTAVTSQVVASAAPTASASASVPPVDYEADDLPEPDGVEKSLEAQRAGMVRRMRAVHGLTDDQVKAVEAVFARSKRTGQGHPEMTVHPMSRKECLDRRKAAAARDPKEPVCGARFMAPLYDPKTQTKADAPVCIDRFEFPNLPCEYPVTWVSWQQGEDLCKALGKRMCDAHEWEGACAGALRAPADEYTFGSARKHQRHVHNGAREVVWSYGPAKDHAKCAMGSQKSPKCAASGWKQCGSNTYPTGAFPACGSFFGVYDLHGNAAEHMALPLTEHALGSRGGSGEPEMKGSWFIFQRTEAHPDDCRWRAPAWHDNEGKGHANYHLGFRCCRDVPGKATPPAPAPAEPAPKPKAKKRKAKP
jgi:sulfatase modifying factor 1